jgi:protocatechuate 3,4-dioxygenase beta subunit
MSKKHSAIDSVSRRSVLGGALLLAVATPLQAAGLAPTPRQATGPFYPESLPLDADSDLVQVEGRSSRGAGDILHLSGRVRGTMGNAIAGARVEIWQCDAHGRYHHAGDRRGGDAADPDFQGFGQTRTNAEGLYRFRTIVPVPYPGRTPHIHVNVSAPGRAPFVTQIYVRAHPLNARDVLFRRLGADAQERVAIDLTPATDIEPGARQGVFEIVLGDREKAHDRNEAPGPRVVRWLFGGTKKS